MFIIKYFSNKPRRLSLCPACHPRASLSSASTFLKISLTHYAPSVIRSNRLTGNSLCIRGDLEAALESKVTGFLTRG